MRLREWARVAVQGVGLRGTSPTRVCNVALGLGGMFGVRGVCVWVVVGQSSRPSSSSSKTTPVPEIRPRCPLPPTPPFVVVSRRCPRSSTTTGASTWLSRAKRCGVRLTYSLHSFIHASMTAFVHALRVIRFMSAFITSLLHSSTHLCGLTSRHTFCRTLFPVVSRPSQGAMFYWPESGGLTLLVAWLCTARHENDRYTPTSSSGRRCSSFRLARPIAALTQR
jgi:hypothetical protein